MKCLKWLKIFRERIGSWHMQVVRRLSLTQDTKFKFLSNLDSHSGPIILFRN